MINLVYFGSPEFSSQILESILGLSHVVAVVTSPDRPLDRKQILTPSSVALTAGKYDLPIFKPEKLDPANLAHLKLLKPDIFLVVSYGKIIPASWLTTPVIGTFNLHLSLLPKYRGALPISEAIKNGDRETGVTLMQMDEQLDHGPIISQAKISIDINDNCETLTNKLTQVGIKLLTEYLPLLASGKFTSTLQDNSQATYTPTTKTRTRQSAFIPWPNIQRAMGNEQSALTTHALIRSLNPDPGAWTKIGNLEIKIIKTSLKCHPRESGLWSPLRGDLYRFPIESGMTLDIVQLPGKNPISWKQFTSGRPPS